jgi:hypothetical protein
MPGHEGSPYHITPAGSIDTIKRGPLDRLGLCPGPGQHAGGSRDSRGASGVAAPWDDPAARFAGCGRGGVKKEYAVARFDPDLGLTPPGYDLSPRSGLRILAGRRAPQNRDERSVGSIRFSLADRSSRPTAAQAADESPWGAESERRARARPEPRGQASETFPRATRRCGQTGRRRRHWPARDASARLRRWLFAGEQRRKQRLPPRPQFRADHRAMLLETRLRPPPKAPTVAAAIRPTSRRPLRSKNCLSTKSRTLVAGLPVIASTSGVKRS